VLGIPRYTGGGVQSISNHRRTSRCDDRGDALDEAAEWIEKDMFLLGATAIKDELQDGVPDTFHILQTAGIRVRILNGDRQETTINMGDMV